MDEHERRARTFLPRDLVEDVAVLPLEEARLAAEPRVLWFMRVAPDARVDGGQRRDPGRARTNRFPKLAELALRYLELQYRKKGRR